VARSKRQDGRPAAAEGTAAHGPLGAAAESYRVAPGAPADLTAAAITKVSVDHGGYRLYLPDWETDYIQGRVHGTRTPYESEMLEDIRSRLKPGDWVLDIGANVGNHAIHLAATAAARVIAFEPNLHLARAIATSAAMNALEERVFPYAIALGERRGSGRFTANIPSNLGAQSVVVGSGDIEVVPLDALPPAGAVRAVKIDVEGMELEVLKGGVELIRRDKPLLYLECQSEDAYRQIVAFLAPLGYHHVDVFNATPTHLFVAGDAGTKKRVKDALLRRLVEREYRTRTQVAVLEERLGRATSGHHGDEADRTERDRMAGELKSVRESLHEAKDNAHRAGVEAHVYKQRLREAVEERQAAERRRDELEALLAEARVSGQTVREGAAGQRERLEREIAERARLAEELRALKDALAARDADLDVRRSVEEEAQRRAIRSEADGDHLRARLDEATARCAEQRQQLSAARMAADIARTRQAEAESERAALLVRLAEAEDRMAVHLREAEEVRSWAEGARDRAESLEDQRASLEAQLEDLATAVDAAVEQVSHRDARLERMAAQLASDAERHLAVERDLKARIRSLTGEIRSSSVSPPPVRDERTEIDAARDRYHGVLGEIEGLLGLPSGAERRARGWSRPGTASGEPSGPSAAAGVPDIGEIVGIVCTIPDRESIARRVIGTILPQVDRLIVYPDKYAAPPEWLTSEPKVTLIDTRANPGLRDAAKLLPLSNPGTFSITPATICLTFDDDILYPPDYVSHLLCALTTIRFAGVVGVHGSILNKDTPRYSRGRKVLHFKFGLDRISAVDILGTGTAAFRAGLFLDRITEDARRPGMVDISFAVWCKKHGVPQFVVARGPFWLRPAETEGEGAARDLYSEMLADSSVHDSLVADAGAVWGADRLVEVAARVGGPGEAPPVADASSRQAGGATPAGAARRSRPAPSRVATPRVVVGIKTVNRLPYLKECLESLTRTVCPGFAVSVIVSDGGSRDGTVEYLQKLSMPFSTETILNEKAYASTQANRIVERAIACDASFVFLVDDDVCFKKKGWMSAYHDTALASGYHHLCHFNLPHYQQLCERRKETFPPPERRHSRFPLVAYGGVEQCMGALFTLTPDVVEAAGWADEVNFAVRGLWHVDYSARCCRAGFNEYERFFDIEGSNDFIELQNTLKETYTTSISWEDPEFKRVSTPAERARRLAVVRMPSRIHVSRSASLEGVPIPGEEASREEPRRVNDFFDRVFVINLERRPDRLAKMRERLDRLGISFEVFPAFDGRDEGVSRQYEEYARLRRAVKPPALPDISSRVFYTGDRSEAERVHYIEKRYGGPAIRSVGAWAYSLTYRAILERCLREGAGSVLVFDDDCLFHRDFHGLFHSATVQLPADWKVFQLGTMQYNREWTRPYSKNLYLPDGVIVASHAVGLHRDVLKPLLRHIDRWSLPFDIGPLQHVCREYREKSFILDPNIVIQDQSESEIASSEVAKAEAEKANNVYGWHLPSYF